MIMRIIEKHRRTTIPTLGRTFRYSVRDFRPRQSSVHSGTANSNTQCQCSIARPIGKDSCSNIRQTTHLEGGGIQLPF
ncbi:hypothetical protein CEXT_259511 [Caerostris extrusa]|uniref:Uncharacterized protein n=1 Tax=Caerostris extrusa TaxID=172846 RepID=A0AAV4WGS3_CAEEX|nr:hypothetical protein CEXT_259511 [Caerostris extrusa]